MLCKLVFVASLAVGVFGLVGDMNLYDHNVIFGIATESCKAFNTEDKVPEVVASVAMFTTCVTKEINRDAITNREFEKAQHPEAYDTILVKKYCAKAPKLKDCARDLFKGVAPCFPPGLVRTSEKSTLALIDFFCDNDGARTISLINDGSRCIKENKIDLNTCKIKMYSDTRERFDRYLGEDTYEKLMAIEKEQCGIVDNALSCVTKELKRCSNKTPAELSQELHDILLDSMACAGVSNILQNSVLRLMLAMILLHLLIGKFNNKC